MKGIKNIEQTNLIFKTTTKGTLYITQAFLNDVQVCECKISVVPKMIWTISSWFTTKEFQHNGYGALTLKACIEEIMKNETIPAKVEYIWNGKNIYVLKWLVKHFDAVCTCPIAVQKYAADDDWESHIYVLNKNKFIAYCIA